MSVRSTAFIDTFYDIYTYMYIYIYIYLYVYIYTYMYIYICVCVYIYIYILVGITAGYGLNGPGIESRWGARFSAPVQTSAHPSSCTIGIWSLSGGV